MTNNTKIISLFLTNVLNLGTFLLFLVFFSFLLRWRERPSRTRLHTKTGRYKDLHLATVCSRRQPLLLRTCNCVYALKTMFSSLFVGLPSTLDYEALLGLITSPNYKVYTSVTSLLFLPQIVPYLFARVAVDALERRHVPSLSFLLFSLP